MKRARERLGTYEILDVVGRGGLAEVVRARGPAGSAGKEIVAIKRLRPHADGADTEQLAATLRDEARLLACIRHENVVRVHEVGLDGSEPFVVMEFVDGATLRALIDPAPAPAPGAALPIVVAVSVVRDVLEGLHAAHSAVDELGQPLQIVHRDVSPENIIVARSGRALVADFGIALARDRLQRTVSNQIKGKVHYIAPEQVHGIATPASDVFAASAVLYELLVGRRLVRARATSEALAELLSLRVVRPSAEGVAISRALEDALLRGLARRPEERFATARELADALAAAVPDVTREAVARWAERRMPAPPTSTSKLGALLKRILRSGSP